MAWFSSWRCDNEPGKPTVTGGLLAPVSADTRGCTACGTRIVGGVFCDTCYDNQTSTDVPWWKR